MVTSSFSQSIKQHSVNLLPTSRQLPEKPDFIHTGACGQSLHDGPACRGYALISCRGVKMFSGVPVKGQNLDNFSGVLSFGKLPGQTNTGGKSPTAELCIDQPILMPNDRRDGHSIEVPVWAYGCVNAVLVQPKTQISPVLECRSCRSSTVTADHRCGDCRCNDRGLLVLASLWSTSLCSTSHI